MGKKREKLHKSMQEETSKKIMKKTRTGEWVVASMLGLMLLGYGVVNIGVEDTDGVEIPTEQLAEEDGATDEDPNKAVVTIDSNMSNLEQEEEYSGESAEVTLEEGSVEVDLGLQNVLHPTVIGNDNNELDTVFNPIADIDTNGDGVVTIAEALAYGFEMPIYSDHWLYEYMNDADNDGMVGDEYVKGMGNFVVDNKDNNNTPVEIIEDEQEVEQEVEEEQEDEIIEDKDIEDKQEVEDVQEDEIIEDVQEGDELPKESETDIEPEEDPVIEETETEVEKPTEDIEEEPKEDEVIPVLPEKDKEVEETDPEVVPQPKPETPQEPVEGEQEEDEQEEEEVQTPEITTSTRTETEQIGYNVIKRENSELAKGEERVVQVGQFGLLETVYGLTFEDGKLVLEELLTSNVITNPVDKVVEIGTYEKQEPVISTSERTETSQIKFTEVKRENPDMPLGEEKVVQEGSYGTLVKTYKVTYQDGVEVSSELVSEVVSEDPVNTIIEFGTFVQEEPEVTEPEVVITTDTRVENETIEYEVEYIETDDLALGDKRVKQYGVDGEREIVYEQTFENGELVNEVVVSDNVVDPIKEIIEVGTYVEPEVEITTETRTETEDIDFDVDYVESSDLLVGEERVVTEGVNGQRELVFEQTFEDGDLVDEVLVSNTVIKDADNKVIEVGTKEVKAETNTETIDFDVIYQDNDELEVGLENTLVEGESGEREIVTEKTFVKGELVGEEVISDTVTKNPVNKVIERGTLVVTHDIETETSDIAFETEVRENSNLEQGVTNVLQEGVNGVYTKEYELTFHNDTLVNKELITEYVSKAPVTHIIEVGTLVETQETVYETEDIDFEIVYQDNDELEVGVENVVQQGSKGELTKEYIVTKHNGHEVNRDLVGQSVTTDAVNQVIERGTLEITTKERIETEDIDFEVVRVANDNMLEGEERVATVGVNGQKEIVFTDTYHNGELNGTELVSENVTVNPINKVIEYGTIKVTTDTREELEDVDFEVERVANDNMFVGEEKVTTEGVNGQRKITYGQTFHNGVLVNEEVTSNEVVTNPVNKVVEYGTIKVTTGTREEFKEVDFEVERVENNTMFEGEERVVTEGVNGQRKKVYEQTFHNGVLVSEKLISNDVATNPINKVIEYGTIVVTTGTRDKFEDVDFEVVRVANNEMFEGEERATTEGVNGQRKITYVQTFHNGKLVNEEVVSNEVVTNPINKVVEYGTIKITTGSRDEFEAIEFGIERVENNTMFEGEERVVTEGVNGQRKKVYEQTYHNGVLVNEELVSNEVDSNPVNKVIEYGTIKVTTGVELEEIILIYETITRENPDMETGTSRVVQEGKNGNIKRTYEVTYHDGLAVGEVLVDTQTTDPVNKIIEVGVAKVTTETEVIVERTEFETEYLYRDDMYVDEESELQHGITGRVDITVEHIYHDGVLVETVEVSRQVIATPTTQVLEVGTKERPEEPTEPETPVEDENQPVITTKVVSTGKVISENFEVIRIANPDMLLGQEKVVQEGYNGLKVIRELVTYEDGYEVGAEFYDYQYMTETQNHIVEYGTKFEITPDGQAEYTDRVKEVLAKSDEEQYQLAIKNREILEDGMISHEESKDLLDPYYYLTKAELTALYLAVDYDKLNDEFGKLVNEHRAGLGLESLGYYEEYKTGSELISKELADYGYIAPEGQDPHTRPDDGRTTTTVFQDIDEDLYNRGVGENLTFHYNLNNPYTIVSEKYLAETMFESWMNSEGHKRNMENAVYTGYAFAIYPVMNNNTKTADRADDGGYENYREVAPHNGIGIMGTLTLIRNAQ